MVARLPQRFATAASPWPIPDSIGDPAEYARLYTGYIRAFGDSALRTQLFEPSAAGEAKADRVAQEFYRRLDTLYRDFPGKYAAELWQLTVVLRRT